MVAALSMVPSVVVSAFAQSQIEGRCVLVFGSAMGSVWEKVLERGARLVHVCDPNPERLAEAAAKNTLQSVSFAQLSSQTPLAVRDGAFDADELLRVFEPAGVLHVSFDQATQASHSIRRSHKRQVPGNGG